ncbi:MAG: RnfABCDGE type electron transport complex subunit D [Lachnospiraceae bacterium]|nr:RnfABCDGE type electron transport complex subunit D [Lachnospiraceae bacterium]
MAKLLNVSSSPHVRNSRTTKKIMYQVILAMMPVTILGVWNHGMGALSVIITAVVAAVASEALFNLITKKPQTIADGSAAVTGLMLALILPPELPLYIPALGSIFAIIVVKCLFGGLGRNFMNPALAARCFLLISFGALVTVYKVDGVATATPLAELAVGKPADLVAVFWGSASGVIGSSAFGLLIGGAMLFAFKIITYEIPVSILVSFTLFLGFFGERGFDPGFHMVHTLCGGVLFGAFFMATDYVTSPVTSKGQLVYGTLIGILMGLFHVFGTVPDSGSYAIIIANMLVPLIDEYTVPVAYGHRKQKEKKGFSIPKPAIILFVITLIAGAALSGVYELTKDTIAEQKLAAEAESYRAVCPAAEEFSSDEELNAAVEALGGKVYGTEFGKVFINRAIVGKNVAGETVGYVISATTGDGFDGDIAMSIGFDLEGTVLGVEFTEINETAGMGMLCAEPEFKDQFVGDNVDAFVLNKAGGSTEANEIDSVSGASVSSGAIVNAVNAAIDFFAANMK